MKLTKEQVYINLQGKTKEELMDLYWFLKNNKEKTSAFDLDNFISRYYCNENQFGLSRKFNEWCCGSFPTKKEITIDQLKQIIKPMGTFTPIAMKCTQEQFEAVKPKLVGLNINNPDRFEICPYLINNLSDTPFFISNVFELDKSVYKRTVYEEWNEEIFLKACGIEVETLQEKAIRLENELKEVKQQIEEENKPKVGDYVYNTDEELFYKKTFEVFNQYERKITNTELIKLLEQEIK